MVRSSRRVRRLAATAAALLLVSLSIQPVDAGDGGGHGTEHVRFTSSEPTVVGGDFGCDPTDPSRCAGIFRTVRTVSGDFAGTTYQAGTAVLLPDGTYRGAAVVQFSGTVDGCGSGTLVIVEAGRLDPATGNAWGTWEISAGQGTGGLAGLSGSLSSDTRISDETTGTIRCR
jgi:hypothetical protein